MTVLFAKQVLQWMPQGHRERGRPRNTWKRDLEREMWTAGFRFSWRKMETAAQEMTERGGDEWSVGHAPLGATRHKSSQVNVMLVQLSQFS